MNLKLLETFVAVARLGGFRNACEQLGATQPAISMRIRELERALGIQLFERANRSSFLTAKGEELLPLAERLLAVMSDIRQQVAATTAVTEMVRVGVSELIAVTWLSDLTAEISRRYPNVMLRFDIDLVHGLARKLSARELDLVLYAGPMQGPGLASVSLGMVELDWFAGPQLDLPEGRLTAAEIERLPLISLSPNSLLHVMALDWFQESSATFRKMNFCTSMHAVSLLVRAGQGLSILPTDYYEPYVEIGAMRILKTAPSLPAIEYLAVYFQQPGSTLVSTIAQSAADISLFKLPTVVRKSRMREKLMFAEMHPAGMISAQNVRSERTATVSRRDQVPEKTDCPVSKGGI